MADSQLAFWARNVMRTFREKRDPLPVMFFAGRFLLLNYSAQKVQKTFRVRELSILYISHNVTHVYVLLNDSCYIEVKCGLALFGKMSIN